ncbi:MAG: hypothetical protein ACI4N3_00055 [Alphaproteobacteria bacterium]
MPLSVGESTEKQGMEVSTIFGTEKCPMANKVYSDDIFVKFVSENSIGISANDSIPLNTIIDKEKLKYYNEIFNSDVYFYFSGANSIYVGFAKCNRINQANNETIALNYNNIDEWCIKSVDEYSLVNHALNKLGEIKVIGGNSIYCDVGGDKPRISWNLNAVYEKAAKNSSNINSLQKVKEVCGKIDVKELEKIYNLTIASTVTSGIGTASSIAGTVTSAISGIEQKKDDEADSKKVNGLNLATTITSAIGGATSGAGAITSGIASSKLKSIIEDIKKCKEEINKIQ